MSSPRTLLRRSLIATFGTLLAAELIVRALAPLLPEPLDWYDATTEVKVAQMDGLGRAEVVFAGTSLVLQGIDPDVFTREDPAHRVAYNAALSSGYPQVMQRWLPEEVLPRLHPKVVVYGVSSLDLNRGHGDPYRTRYDHARATRRGIFATLDRAAAHVSAIFAHRGGLRADVRSLEPLYGSPVGIETLATARTILGPHGQRMRFRPNVTESARRRVRDQVLDSYAIGAPEAAALGKLIEVLHSQGVRVVLLFMPVPLRYTELHPAGKQDLLAAREFIERAATTSGAEFLDMSAGFHDYEFVDYTHLGGPGAEQLSANIARALR